MKITFLGTNGWYSNENGNTLCTLLEAEEYYIVFDAGDGLHKLGDYAVKNKPIFLFLSHLHLDHIVGFHTLDKFRFKNKLTVFCPKGTKKHLDKIIDHPFTASASSFQYEFSIEELEEGKHEFPFPFECKRLLHVDGSFGYSLMLEGKKITHLCDTGLCENAKFLAADSDVVLHECSLRNEVSDEVWGHVGAVGAAMVARDAKVEKLVLTHFNAEEFPLMADRENALQKAKEIFENTSVARDNESFEV